MDDETATTAPDGAPDPDDDAVESAGGTPNDDPAVLEARKALIRSMLELAEEPGLWIPGSLGVKVFQGEGFTFVGHSGNASVNRVRLKRSEVEPTVERVGAIAAIQDFTEVVWWVGRLSRPKDLGERLVALGLEPADPPQLLSLVIERPPGAEPDAAKDGDDAQSEDAPDSASADPTGAEEVGPADEPDGTAAGSTEADSGDADSQTTDSEATDSDASDGDGALDEEDEDPSGVRVVTVATLPDLLTALEIEWECSGIPEEERAERRAETQKAWPILARDPRLATHLAYLDDEPVGFARAILGPYGALLLGAATLPHARRRGVYTALVRARWRTAVRNHTPRLAVSVGPDSVSILRSLGFTPIGRVSLFRQTL